MADKSDKDLLIGIIDLCESIKSAVAGKSLQQFEQDDILRDAVAYRLAAIGEDCKGLSAAVKKQHDLPWKQIIGMRNRLAHDYFGSAPKVVFETATGDLDPLCEACRASLTALSGEK
ncbi:HepT-like ribonuclease domain-containing protein [Hyphococcus sp.]|uniref:HepT-like ribonuclease domain-containing protein n=1 Tax=Hyphococcus sp. TaxID=2038636 RepID=UPI0035C762B9